MTLRDDHHDSLTTTLSRECQGDTVTRLSPVSAWTGLLCPVN